MRRENLRWGVTTGTCAAGAAKAAAIWLLKGSPPGSVSVTLPSGEEVGLMVKPLDTGRCGVVKDAGDDPDSTNGLLIEALVTLGSGDGDIAVAAGEGVGIVTLPGLKVPPGSPAINPVPRMMIESSVRQVIGARSANVVISIPGGRDVAERTFNKRLGIEGGLSILGTTGRVRPMDPDALFESLSLELRTHSAQGRRSVVLTFGNSGEGAVSRAWRLPEGLAVQVTNEIGFVLDECAEQGFESVIVAGRPGKLLKVAAGSFNTHNRVSDGRMEALCAHIGLITGSVELMRKVYDAPSAGAAMMTMRRELSPEEFSSVWKSLAERAAQRCLDRSFGRLGVGTAFIDDDGTVLGESSRTASILDGLREDRRFDGHEREPMPR
jgi:cobalt-precorrin-5B (C1)-methyltransferase